MTDAESSVTRSSFNEWHTLVVGLQGALVTGFIYAYSTYSNSLQNALGLHESQKAVSYTHLTLPTIPLV